MNANRFDAIAKLFAARRGQRATARQGAATPAAEPFDPGRKIPYLFVQSFRSGAIVPKEGEDGVYTLTLAQGLGQTIYFSNRPGRDVGALPTPQFLDRLGFDPANPPNAALVAEVAPGDTVFAVVELFDPRYDPDSPGVTYDVTVLAEWERTLDLGFVEQPADLARVAPSFGTAHLLIDDCADGPVICERSGSLGRTVQVGTIGPVGFCWNYSVCMACDPYGHTQPSRGATTRWWSDRCNQTFPDCQGRCLAQSEWPRLVD